MVKTARVVYGLLFVLGLCVAIASPAWAQAPVNLDSAQIELWPEYDRPEMLVILAGNLPADTQLPTTLTLRLPPTGTLFAAATRDAQDELVNTTYTTGEIDGRPVVTLTLNVPNFHLEYYDRALVMDGDQRRFSFAWPAEWAAAAVRVRVQEPAGARDLTVTPALSPAGTGEFGLDYLAGDLGAITPGQPARVDIVYTKSTTGLSAETAAPVTTGSSLLPAPVLIGLAVLAGALMLGIWIWNRQRVPTTARARRSHARADGAAPANKPTASRTTDRSPTAKPPAPTTRPALPTSTADPVAGPSPNPQFCTQCGQPLQPGDRFCRQCGTPARSGS